MRLARSVLVASAVVGAVTVGRFWPDPAPPSRRPAASSPQTTPAAAVGATLAAGSVRFTGSLASAGGPPVRIEGRISFTHDRSQLRVDQPGPGSSAGIEVRSTPAGIWLRAPGVDDWLEVAAADDQAGAGREALTGWTSLFERIGRSPLIEGDRRRLRVFYDGEPATLDLDEVGRIRRLRIVHRREVLDLRFSDYGAPVDIEPPAGGP